MNTTDCDCLVVGAGLAGLTAARHLHDAGARVHVLEATDRVGGRTRTEVIEGATVDVGGQWIGPGQPRMHALVEAFGLETFPTPIGGTQVLDLHGQLRRYAGSIPRLNPLELVQLQALVWTVDRLAGTLSAEAPWTSDRAARWDAQTVDAWSRRWIPSANVRALLNPSIRTVFGAEPGELSLLHFLTYVASAGGLMRLLEVDGGFQQTRFVHGAQAVSEGLADRLGRDRITLGAPVRAVTQDGERVTVHTDAGTRTARRLILAAPLALLDRIHFEPGLPALRDQLHQRCPMGNTVKVFAGYERAFWRDRGLSGEAVCTDGPLSVTFDNTAPGGPPMLLSFIVGTPARDWSDRPEAARRAVVLDALARWFGEEARSPVWTHEIDWSRERWAGGCPITQFPPGTLSVFGPALRRPVGRIHWAGTETARVCTGFMEGAVESGERAAEEVLAAR